MKITTFLLAFVFNATVFAQIDTLVGLVDGKLIKIHLGDAGVTDDMDIAAFPITYDPYRLTWCEASNCYFGLAYSSPPSYTTSIIRVTEAGDYSVVAPLTIPGETVYFAESISYNRFDQKLYVSGSLNGAPPADYDSETLIRIDTNTWIGEIAGTFFDLAPSESDADQITFDDLGNLYYCDAQPGGGGFLRFFKQDIGFILTPSLIYSTSYYVTSDLTVRDNVMYFSGNRILRKIDLTTNTYSIVGNMFTPADYSGKLLRGITWRTVCESEDATFSYLAENYCNDADPVFPDLIATPGGAFSASPLGLLIDPVTGEISPSLSDPGVYEVTYAIIDDCPASESVSITIFPNPELETIDDFVFCDGELTDEIVFTGTPDTDFEWSNDNPDIGLGINGTGNIPPFVAVGGDIVVSGTITVVPVIEGCVGDTQVFNVTINPSLIAGFDYSDHMFCATDSPVLPSTIEIVGGIFSATPAGLSLDPITGELDPSASSAGIYNVSYSLLVDCPIDSTISIEIIPIPVVNPLPDLMICQGDLSVEINIGGTPGAIFDWSNDNIGIGLGSDGVGNIPPFTTSAVDLATTGLITITATLAGCIGNPTTFEITVNPSPIVDFFADVYKGCQPLEVKFTPSGTSIVGDCQWYFGDGTTSSDCGIVNHTYTIDGLVDVKLIYTDENGCSSQKIYLDYIDILKRPIASFYPSTTTISDLDVEVGFENTSLFAASYEWSFGDGSVFDDQENPTHLFGNSNYEVRLVAFGEDNYCSDTSWQKIYYVEQILFFVPNTFTPDGDDFNNVFKPVMASGVDPYDYYMVIYNRWGEIVFETYNLNVGWNGSFGTNGSLVQDGVYVWHIEFGTTNPTDEKFQYTGHITVLK